MNSTRKKIVPSHATPRESVSHYGQKPFHAFSDYRTYGWWDLTVNGDLTMKFAENSNEEHPGLGEES
jgi:hypothetical protein